MRLQYSACEILLAKMCNTIGPAGIVHAVQTDEQHMLYVFLDKYNVIYFKYHNLGVVIQLITTHSQ